MSLWPPMWFDLLHEGNFEAMGIEGNMGVEKGKNWEEEEMEEEKVEGERAAIPRSLCHGLLPSGPAIYCLTQMLNVIAPRSRRMSSLQL